MVLPQFIVPLLDFRVMGLCWILAYGIVLIFVRRVVILLETGHPPRRGFGLLFGVLFAGLVWVFFAAPPGILRWLDGDGGFSQRIPTLLLWGFSSAVWAGLDGVFVVYAARIYALLNTRLSPRTSGSATPSVAARPFITGLPLVGLLALFFVYHYAAASFDARHELHGYFLPELVFFFTRICGVFWVAFEGTLAVLTFRIFLLLKRAAV